MRIFEIGYLYDYSNTGRKWETEQVTEESLERIKGIAAEGKYYQHLKILNDHGERNTNWLETWVEIAKRKPWIAQADDPSFDESMLVECKTLDYLVQQLEQGNYCIGQGFYYNDLCFINQVDGGDEWLTIRRGKHFDSISCRGIIRTKGTEYFKRMVNAYLKASDDELTCMDYYRENIFRDDVTTIRKSLKELQDLSDKANHISFGLLKIEDGMKKVYLKPLSLPVDHLAYQAIVTIFDTCAGEVMIDQYILQ